MEGRIPTQDENPDGLHQRYRIEKADGSPVEYGSEYFVLRLDDGGSDPNHIEACKAAVLRYSEKIKDHIPQLATDLKDRYGNGINEEDRNSAAMIQKDIDYIKEIKDEAHSAGRVSDLLDTWLDDLQSLL